MPSSSSAPASHYTPQSATFPNLAHRMSVETIGIEWKRVTHAHVHHQVQGVPLQFHPIYLAQQPPLHPHRCHEALQEVATGRVEELPLLAR